MDPTFNIIIGCIEFDLIQLFGEFKYENTSDNYFYVYDVDSLQVLRYDIYLNSLSSIPNQLNI